MLKNWNYSGHAFFETLSTEIDFGWAKKKRKIKRVRGFNSFVNLTELKGEVRENSCGVNAFSLKKITLLGLLITHPVFWLQNVGFFSTCPIFRQQQLKTHHTTSRSTSNTFPVITGCFPVQHAVTSSPVISIIVSLGCYAGDSSIF